MVVIDATQLFREDERSRFSHVPLFDSHGGVSRRMRRRANPSSLRDAPDGTIKCREPGCSLFLSSPKPGERFVECLRGHEFDVEAAELADLERPHRMAHIGISRTEQGKIAEQIVREYGDLGRFGKVSQWIAGSEPLDGLTDRKWGVEVKSINGPMAKNHAFTRCSSRSVERKNAEIVRLSLNGIVGVLVILDFDTSIATIYVRGIDRMMYFEKHTAELLAVVSFEHINPVAIARKQAKLDLVGDDIPF